MKFINSLLILASLFIVLCLSNTVNAVQYQYFVFEQHRCGATRNMEIDKCLPVSSTPMCTGSLKVAYLPDNGNYTFKIYPSLDCSGNPVALSNFSCDAGSTPTTFQGFSVSCFNPTFKYFVINQKQCNASQSLQVDTCLAVNGTSSQCSGSVEVSFIPTATSNEFTFNAHTNNNCNGTAALSSNFTCSTSGAYKSYNGFDVACYNEKQVISSSSDDGSSANSSSFISVSILLLVVSCLLSII